MAVISPAPNVSGTTSPSLGNRFLPTGMLDDAPVYSNRSKTWFLWYDRQGEGWAITPIAGEYPASPAPHWTKSGIDPEGYFTPQGTATGEPNLTNRDPIGDLAGKFSGSTVYGAHSQSLAMRRTPSRHTRGPRQFLFANASILLAALWWEDLTVELHDEWLEYADAGNNARRTEGAWVKNGWLSFVHSGFAAVLHGEDIAVVAAPRVSAACELAALFAYRTAPNTIVGTLTSEDESFPAPTTALFVYQVYPGKHALPGSRFQTRFCFAYTPDDDSPGPYDFTGSTVFPIAADETAYFLLRYHRGLSPTQTFFRSLTWLDA